MERGRGLFSFFTALSAANPSEVKAAKEARAARDKADADACGERSKAAKKAASQSCWNEATASGSKKGLSNDPEAIRSRERRKREAAKREKQRAKAFNDSNAAAANHPEPADVEKETHYTDNKGRKRKRKRKTLRSRTDGVRYTKAGSVIYSDTECRMVAETFDRIKARNLPGDTELYAKTAKDLRSRLPTTFSKLGRQQVRQIILRRERTGALDGRGRFTPLPAVLITAILLAFTSVVKARATVISAPMLQPIAIGIIIAHGYTSLLREGRGKRGEFCCGLHFVRGLMKQKGWRNVKPQGDTRKVPPNWAELVHAMVLRLAYFVWQHDIPKELVVNGDHTGVHFTQRKGKTWITEEMHKSGDKSLQNHGDKRQCTVVTATSAAGEMLPHQTVMEGKTVRALPNLGAPYSYSHTLNKSNSKGTRSFCFVPSPVVAATWITGIASFCLTANHWSDNITSRAWITDVVVPYFKRKIEEMRATSLESCKEFGTQVCVVIVDVWWGWIDAGWKAWLAETHPWIRLLYVPPRCTPKGQPMDAGIIAMLKGILRRQYGTWVCDLVQRQLRGGTKPEEITVPSDVPTCKRNLVNWLSEAVPEMNTTEKSGMLKCWEATGLHKAWNKDTQREAVKKLQDGLFPNLDLDQYNLGDEGMMKVVAALVADAQDNSEDQDAGWPGLPVLQTVPGTVAQEWERWIDWDSLGSASSA